MGSAAHRLHDARDRVTESTRRAHGSQRRADRTIDTSRTPGRRPLRSSGAACRSTSHTAHPAEDTHRVLRGHRRLLRRPAGLSRCAELRRSQVQRMAGDVFLPSTPALVRTHQAPPTGGAPHCGGGRGGRRWRRAGSPALALTSSLPRSTLVAEGVFEAVEPTDMAAALIRRERFRGDLLLRGGEAGFEAGSFLVRCAVPGEERPSLIGCEASTWQRPAVQVRWSSSCVCSWGVFAMCASLSPAGGEGRCRRGCVPRSRGRIRAVLRVAVSTATRSVKLSLYGNGDVRSSAAASSPPSAAARGAGGWRRKAGRQGRCPGSSAVCCSSVRRRLPGGSPNAHTPR